MVTLVAAFPSFIQQDVLVNLQRARHWSHNDEQAQTVSTLITKFKSGGEVEANYGSNEYATADKSLKKKMEFDSMRRQHRKLTKFMALEEAPHGNGAGAES